MYIFTETKKKWRTRAQIGNLRNWIYVDFTTCSYLRKLYKRKKKLPTNQKNTFLLAFSVIELSYANEPPRRLFPRIFISFFFFRIFICALKIRREGEKKQKKQKGGTRMQNKPCAKICITLLAVLRVIFNNVKNFSPRSSLARLFERGSLILWLIKFTFFFLFLRAIRTAFSDRPEFFDFVLWSGRYEGVTLP